jgi:hypothetical protein
MLYLYRTQTLDEYIIGSSFAVFYNGIKVGSAKTLTGAHCLIVSQMMKRNAQGKGR